MRHHTLLVLVVLAAASAVGAAGRAHHIRGICFFNQQSMPCSVSEDPYTLKLLRVDGRTERFAYVEAEDSFVGPQDDFWHVSHDQSRGVFLQDQDGDAVGFVERPMTEAQRSR